jgi:AhpD family alkylhydroperoxidase
MKPIQALIASTRQGDVPETTLGLVHLRASQINGCSFCVDSGSKHAKQAGETDERLVAVAAWREAPYFTDAERAALALAEAVTRLSDRAAPGSRPGRRRLRDPRRVRARITVTHAVRERSPATAASASPWWPLRTASGDVIDGESAIGFVAKQPSGGGSRDDSCWAKAIVRPPEFRRVVSWRRGRGAPAGGVIEASPKRSPVGVQASGRMLAPMSSEGRYLWTFRWKVMTHASSAWERCRRSLWRRCHERAMAGSPRSWWDRRRV